MSLAQSTNFILVEDYLSAELKQSIRHEYVDGQVYAMAGASMNHNRITSNLVRLLGNHLASQACEVFSRDMLLQTSANRYRYPDVVVSCQTQAENELLLSSPMLLVEVMSHSTRKTDKEIKRLEYLQLPSLMEYMLIEQDFVEIEVLRRSQNWQPSYYYLGDEVVFESIGLSLPVLEIYQRVVNRDMERSGF
ncbi:Uma2 family endonuclease [Thiothrix eikelboomii]|uniref:Uma2 family endonuclease n=1 Tax=Thiothrix eikelboomii TaxID=92487 RepID=UPI003BB07FE6